MKKLLIACVILLTLVTFYATRFNNVNETPADEDTFSWLYRINYYPWIVSSNLKGIDLGSRDLKYAGTISYHPGVTIMTLSGISTKIGKARLEKADPDYETCAYLDYGCKYLGDEMLMAKIPLIIVSGVLFALSVYLLSRVFSVGSTAIYASIVLFEPLLLSASKLLHLDFLFGMFAITAVSSLLYSIDKKIKWMMFTAGALMGFALLTRFAGSFMIPGIIAGIIYLDYKNSLRNISLFALGGFVAFIGFYPPMWVAPIETLTYIIKSSVEISDNLAETLPAYVRYLNSLQWYFGVYIGSFSSMKVWLFLIGVLGIGFSKIKKKKFIYSFLIIYLSYFSFINLADKHYIRYLVPILIGLAPVIGVGVYSLICPVINRIRNI